MLLILALAGVIVWYVLDRRQRLSADPVQQHLASMLIAVASGERPESELRAFIDGQRRSRYKSSSRIKHAVWLASASTDPALQQRVVAVAAGLRHS